MSESRRSLSFPYSVTPHPSSRAPEFYGFVALTSTFLGFVIYILWAILPDRVIEYAGVTWYPNREWAILLPAWSAVTVLLAYMVYISLAIHGAPSFAEIRAVTDSRAHFPSLEEYHESPRNVYERFAIPNAIPELYDIPVALVNRVVYRR